MIEYPGTSSGVTPVECQAFIVGPNHFQNLLLTAYIETHSAWNSYAVDTLAAIPDCSGTYRPGRVIVLYDCYGLSVDDALLNRFEELPREWILVLFNLDRRTGIEKHALESGVHGFFYHDDNVEILFKGLTAIFGGEFWVSRQMLTEILLEQGFPLRRKQLDHTAQGSHQGLTHREIEILGMLSLGASNKIISEKLFISPNTVRTHLNHIFRKIQVSNRLEAVVWASDYLFMRSQ